MAHKRHEANGVESKTGYTGKYFRYDQPVLETNQALEEMKEKRVKRQKSKKKKK
jgi:hypothetical protein